MERDEDPDTHEAKVAALGVAKAASILTAHFDLVITNFPYLARGKHDARLADYCDRIHPRAKQDLATALLERTYRQLREHGTIATVSPQNWLHQKRYAKFRASLLNERHLALVAVLGASAFETITGAVVQPVLTVISGARSQTAVSRTMDIGTVADPARKAKELLTGTWHSIDQDEQARNADAVLMVVPAKNNRGAVAMSTIAGCGTGVQTFDRPRFIFMFWELPAIEGGWVRMQSTVPRTMPYGGCEQAFRWEDGDGDLFRLMEEKRVGEGYTSGIWRAGNQFWGKAGVLISLMGEVQASIYTGHPFDQNVAPIIPQDESLLPALWAFASSPEFRDELRSVDRSLKVTPSSLGKIQFDIERWTKVAETEFPRGLPVAASDSPDQWLFRGHPRTSDAPLQVAVARLLGFCWPDQKPDVLDSNADADGIVCIPALRGERPAADRLADLLAVAWGTDWHPQTLTNLLTAVGHQGTLEEWLRDGFFRQHCELFHHRPFIWHIWDGHREGFSALVNYHSLDHETLKSLTYTYLGDWIRTQEIETKAGTSGAGDKLAKARVLQQRLATIIEGEDPLDIFVRWKAGDEQPIGWYPDLDDGVRLNIRPFLLVQDVSGKGAGVLRCRPNIKWGKDRGKNPPGTPWGDDRDNDRHLMLAEKKPVRGKT